MSCAIESTPSIQDDHRIGWTWANSMGGDRTHWRPSISAADLVRGDDGFGFASSVGTHHQPALSWAELGQYGYDTAVFEPAFSITTSRSGTIDFGSSFTGENSMTIKRAGIEVGWASIAGFVGWVGTYGGMLAVFAIIVFLGMASFITAMTIHGALTRGTN